MTLPVELFNRHRSGYQWWCRECFRQYFKERGDRHRTQSGEAKRLRVLAAKDHVLAYLRARPCIDCGAADPVVLEFDHLNEKRWDVAVMCSSGAATNDLDLEIANCEVVCVNCHRRRTARRSGWRRAAPQWWRTKAPRPWTVARNLAYAYSALEQSGCVDCGEVDLTVLDFDHLGAKRGNVTRLARDGISLADLAYEIDGCHVRCGNCHRRRTAHAGGHHRALASA